MSEIENLIIENYPTIDILKMTITTEFLINSEHEISISINNANILSSDDIMSIEDNIIKLIPDINLNKEDAVVIIYNKVI